VLYDGLLHGCIEQRSQLDEAIEKQTKLIAAKEQRKKALMQQLLSGKKRLPGFTEDWKEVSRKIIFGKGRNQKRRFRIAFCRTTRSLSAN
jgi:restriction endonuclease S subunit